MFLKSPNFLRDIYWNICGWDEMACALRSFSWGEEVGRGRGTEKLAMTGWHWVMETWGGLNRIFSAFVCVVEAFHNQVIFSSNAVSTGNPLWLPYIQVDGAPPPALGAQVSFFYSSGPDWTEDTRASIMVWTVCITGPGCRRLGPAWNRWVIEGLRVTWRPAVPHLYPNPQFLIQWVWDGAQEFAFPTSSQAMLLLLQGPHRENSWFG